MLFKYFLRNSFSKIEENKCWDFKNQKMFFILLFFGKKKYGFYNVFDWKKNVNCLLLFQKSMIERIVIPFKSYKNNETGLVESKVESCNFEGEKMVAYHLVELEVCQIHCSYTHIIFLASFASQGVLYKDPTVWLDGARPPLTSLFMSLTNSEWGEISCQFLPPGGSMIPRYVLQL